MKEFDFDRRRGAVWGSFIGDAHAMSALARHDCRGVERDRGDPPGYAAPQNPPVESVLLRSECRTPEERVEILHDRSQLWAPRGLRHHSHLASGENSLNLRLAGLLLDSLRERGAYDADDYLRRHADFMRTVGSHRNLFGNSGAHIGGLAHVGILCARFGRDVPLTREIVREHISLTHPNDALLRAADIFTRMLCAVLDALPLRQAIMEHGSEYFAESQAQEWREQEDEFVVGSVFGPSSRLQDAFPTILYFAWKYAGNFAEGIIANANLGGDGCQRSAVLGALLGGAQGEISIPGTWIDGLAQHYGIEAFLAPGMGVEELESVHHAR